MSQIIKLANRHQKMFFVFLFSMGIVTCGVCVAAIDKPIFPQAVVAAPVIDNLTGMNTVFFSTLSKNQNSSREFLLILIGIMAILFSFFIGVKSKRTFHLIRRII